MMRAMSDQRPYAALGERIRYLREAADLSQTAFAARVTEELRKADSRETATQPAVSLWERGLNAPSTAKLRAIAHVTGTGWFELLELKEQLDAQVDIAAESSPMGYDTRISQLPPSARAAIDAMLDALEDETA